MENKFYISTDKSKLDINLIFNFLNKKSYWANGRSIETVKKTIEHSLCFGVYTNNKQVGFARVVTDYAVFAWIMDVFIIEEHRGNGFAKLLMKNILEHPALKGIERWRLATTDAHSLYEQFGFKILSNPKNLMELIVKTN